MIQHTSATAERRALVAQLLRRAGIQRSEDGGIPRRARTSPCEPSYAQQRLWLVTQLRPASAAYNVAVRLRLEGTLSLRAVTGTLDLLVARHESLRTSFEAVNGEPMQVVHASRCVQVPLVDLSELPVGVREHAARRLARQDARRVFDLARAPLLRVALLRLARAEHVALFTMHHIVSDGWSMGVLTREFSQAYAAAIAGRPVRLPELPVQYADFAAWQRARLQGGAFERQVGHWKQRLADLPPVELPTDRPKRARRGSRAGSEALTLTPEIVSRLRAFSHAAGVTMFVTAAAAVFVWLYRYTGQGDLAIGSPIASRTRSELEGLIGFFVNQIVLRVGLSGSMTFRDVVDRVREIALDAYAHQDVPFDRVVEEVRPGRDADEHPLFQVAVAFLNTPAATLDVPGLRASRFAVDAEAPRFDLELHLRDTPEHLFGVLFYDADLFEAATVARMLGHLTRLMDAGCRNAGQRVGDLPLLTGGEYRQIVEEWNDTARDWHVGSVLDLFDAQAASTPDAIAVAEQGDAWTYRALHEDASRIACWLRSSSQGPEARVAICMRRSGRSIAAVLGVLKAGAAYVPLDADSPPARLSFQLADTGVGIVLTDEPSAAAVPAGDWVVAPLDTPTAAWRRASDVVPRVTVRRDDLAYVIYTSGSTGRPKGVMITHGGLLNYVCWAREAYPFGLSDGTLFHSSLAFDMTITSVLVPLVVGASIRVVAADGGVDGFTQAFRQGRFDVVKATPAHLHALADTMREDELRGRARAFVVGGEALDAAIANHWLSHAPGTAIFNEYGPTETVVGCCVQAMTAERVWQDPVPIGRPISNTTLHVMTADQQLAPVGVRGELWIGGAGVARGYLARPDQTAARFVPDPFSREPGARAYRSGDRARYRADGTLEFFGRSDDQTKIRGYRIEPGEVEAALARHPAVREVIVTAVSDGERGTSLAAYVAPDVEYVLRQRGARLDEAAAEHVSRWRTVFDDAVAAAPAADHPTTNFAGWTSSYTGEPIPEPEMQLWVDGTVDRILALRPRRVLEIGCGTGLLLFRVAPHCAAFVGTDPSSQALAFVASQLRRVGPPLAHVQLRQQAAHELAGVEGPFDTIVVNSVVQYFPSVEYLTDVLTKAAQCLAPGGAMFVGDVRCLPLLEAFHASVQLHRASPGARCDRLRQLVRSRAADEEELVVDPAYFATIGARVPRLAGARILLKCEDSANELATFRYDVVLHSTTSEVRPAVTSVNWHGDRSSAARIRDLLDAERPEVLEVHRVPNHRVVPHVRALEALMTAGNWESVADLRARVAAEPGAAPLRELCALARAGSGYRVELSWARCDRTGACTATFVRDGCAAPLAIHSAEPQRDRRPALANGPVHRTLASALVPDLREHLAHTLPAYMIPATITILPTLPLAASGKIDRAALPRPVAPGARRAAGTIERATPVEELLAGIWSEVLGLDRVGTADDFFDLGGHSLLATQVMSRVRRAFGVELPLRRLFEAPTIAGLAAVVARASASARETPPALVPAARTGPMPLSFAQQRLWFLHRLDPGSAFYNVPAALHLRGALDTAALQRSVSTIVLRHDVLRTRVECADEGPVQVAGAVADVPLPVVSLERLPEAARTGVARRLARDEAARPFELHRGPVFRVRLLRLTPDEHVLLVTLHHIVSDAWSIAILVREMSALYRAFALGGPNPLPPLPVQYADFAVWQRSWLSGPVLDGHLSYWREQIGDRIDDEELFVRRRSTNRPSRRRGQQVTTIARELTDRLGAASRGADVTMFMTLLAAFEVVLHAWTGRELFVVGTDVANRRDPQLESLVGFLVNQLVLRADLRGNPSFEELLARTRTVALGAYEHEDLPFERLVESLRPGRDAGRHPLFQVKFALQNAPAAALALPGVTLQPFGTDLHETTVDLMLTMVETRGTLAGILEYATDLFDEATVAAMLAGFVTVLEEVAGDPSCRVEALAARLQQSVRAVRRSRQQAYAAAVHESLARRSRSGLLAAHA